MNQFSGRFTRQTGVEEKAAAHKQSSNLGKYFRVLVNAFVRYGLFFNELNINQASAKCERK